MKTFNTFVSEANELANSKTNTLNFIVSNFYRFINKEDKDNKALLLLIAALTVLNTAKEGDTQVISTARRLAQSALSRPGRGK
jgi:hypothetical protein